MRKTDVTQHSLYSYRTLEERIPDAHPLRKLRVLVDAILVNMNDDFQALYSRRGRPSIAPERLLRASLIQTLFSIRSERQLVQHIEWFCRVVERTTEFPWNGTVPLKRDGPSLQT